MFTGLVEGIGHISTIIKKNSDIRLGIKPLCFTAAQCVMGESIAVNGICLTVTEAAGGSFFVDASSETISSTTLKNIAVGKKVNLERALRLSDRLGGHIVSGHVDGVVSLITKETSGRSFLLKFNVPSSLRRYIIEKGSVTVDGVSLTVVRCYDASFEVNIIPLTGQETTLLDLHAGDYVNIETDIIGKYVEQLLCVKMESAEMDGNKKNSISMEKLIKYGFGG